MDPVTLQSRGPDSELNQTRWTTLVQTDEAAVFLLKTANFAQAWLDPRPAC